METKSCENNCFCCSGDGNKRRCCAQSTCTTKDDEYTVFEDTPYTMSVLSNDDGKAGLYISGAFTPVALSFGPTC